MTFAGTIMEWVTLAIGLLGAVVGLIAFVDAVVRRPDAFPAADKQTKVAWLGITAISGIVLVFGSYPLWIFPPPHILWMAAMVGSLVYLLDVRPRLREVTGGTAGW